MTRCEGFNSATVRAGTATPDPQIAPGPGVEGQLPLAIVKLSTALAAFTDDFVPVMLCRPMLGALGKQLVPDETVIGGGISVGEETASVFGDLQVADIHYMRADILGLQAELAGNASFQGTINAMTSAPKPPKAPRDRKKKRK